MNIYAYDQFHFMKITKFVKKTKFEKMYNQITKLENRKMSQHI